MPKTRRGHGIYRPRQEHEKKPIRSGVKSQRGQPELYDELKKIVSVSITPTAKAGLAELSATRKISLSELVERIGRRIIHLNDSDSRDSPNSLPLSPAPNNALPPQ